MGGEWPLISRGGTLNIVFCRVNRLVNVDSRQYYHDNCAWRFFIRRLFLFSTLICDRLLQNKAKLHVLNFGWQFKRSKGNRKTSLGQSEGGLLLTMISGLQ